MPLTVARRILLNAVSENHFRQTVRQWAEDRGWLVYFTWSSRHSPSGFPDLVMLRPPRLILAELKRQDGRPTPRQLLWLKLLRGVPCIEAHLWRPWDEDEILAALA